MRSRSRTRLHRHHEDHDYQHHVHNDYVPAKQPIHHRGVILPDDVVKMILMFVCPHMQDDTYSTSEDSMSDGGCMLCDMRDLAQCALVRRAWGNVAAMLL